MKRLLICFGLLWGTLTLMAQELSIEGGRFRKGDDPAWSSPAFDDSSWQEVTFNQSWEELVDYANGYGWYRIHVVIPSSLKKGVVEAIMLDLGAIDDSDQTWLNGHPVGKDGTFPEDPDGYSSEWGRRRHYIVDPSWVRWDRENIIAVRVYNYGTNAVGLFNLNETTVPVSLAGVLAKIGLRAGTVRDLWRQQDIPTDAIYQIPPHGVLYIKTGKE